MPSHAFSRSVPSLVLVMSFRFVRLVSRLPACCLSPPLRMAGPSRHAPLRSAGPSRVALFPDLPALRLLRLPSGSCPDLPPRLLRLPRGRALLASGLPVASFRFRPSGLFPSGLPPGSCLTCLRAPCGLFSVRTIRVIPKLPSGLCPDLPPRFLLPSLVRTFHPPLGLYLFLPPPGYFSGSSSLR